MIQFSKRVDQINSILDSELRSPSFEPWPGQLDSEQKSFTLTTQAYEKPPGEFNDGDSPVDGYHHTISREEEILNTAETGVSPGAMAHFDTMQTSFHLTYEAVFGKHSRNIHRPRFLIFEPSLPFILFSLFCLLSVLRLLIGTWY